MTSAIDYSYNACKEEEDKSKSLACFHSLCFDLVHFAEDSVLDPVDELEGVDGEGGGGEEEEDHQPHDQVRIRSRSNQGQIGVR